jgi:polysaccharide export outer membrane protein
VLQAIAEAGGLSDYAKPKKIYILRNVDGKQTRLPFDYQAVIRGERIEQNIPLLPDDTIIVPH